MKKAILIVALLAGVVVFAQDDNLESTTTTKTTVRSSKGEKTSLNREKTKRKARLEVENNNETNQRVRRSQEVSKTTRFSVDNNAYKITPDKNGYIMTMAGKNGTNKPFGKIRKMPDKEFYILTKKDGDSFGYFDRNGNFVVESYDPSSDSVVSKKYMVGNKNTRMRKR